MHVTEITDDYSLLGTLESQDPDQLRAADAGQSPPPRRWVALVGDTAVGAVSTRLRPDDRWFLRFVGAPESYAELTDAVVDALVRPVYAFARTAGERAHLERAGFAVENVTENFTVRFDRALALTSRAWLPTGYSIHRADEVDEEKLFELDNMLRQDVPGSDGWRGNREWFHDELHDDPAFDPAAYLVARHDESAELVGLIRIWHNESGPRLGLIGVRREHRGSTLAPHMLHRALEAAATWGSEVFDTGTSLSNTVVYPRLSRIGDSQGRSWQLVKS